MRALFGALIITAIAATAWAEPSAPLSEFKVRFDANGPYLILATTRADHDFPKAIAAAKVLHPNAVSATCAANDLAAAKKILLAEQPHYILLFIKPDELDVNFAWQWLTICTQLNDDPLVDVCTGVITGSSPEAAEAFVKRISDAVNGHTKLPGRLVDNFGPNSEIGKTDFQQFPGNFMIPALGPRLGLNAISHGTQAFSDKHLDSMRDAGLIHFGGHGHPDQIDDGLRASQVKSLQLSPCVVFNGACYTGVTNRWFDQFTTDGKVVEKTVADDSFCLNFLKTTAIAYFAALHPDHGIPVYQEMEYLAYSGASMGEVIKHTHDGVIISAGGHVPKFEKLAGGMPAPAWSPSEMMLKGTASRMLFGDPSVIVTDPFIKPPFNVETKADRDSLHITAIVSNPLLRSSFADTYFSDLASDKNLFNDRALIAVDLPQNWKTVSGVEVLNATAGGKPLKHRAAGYAIESHARKLWIQVDLPSEGFMQSRFRVEGSAIELKVKQ